MVQNACQNDSISESAGADTDTIQTSLASLDMSTVNFTNVENLAYTGASAFTGTGNSGANSITGGGFSDLLSGGAGNDTISGGSPSTVSPV